jgi:hypothetical protein
MRGITVFGDGCRGKMNSGWIQARATAASTKNNNTSSKGLGSRRMIFHTMMLMQQILRVGGLRRSVGHDLEPVT